MKIRFTKAHGAHNDFLLTWRPDAPEDAETHAGIARAICDRHTGIGADGWMLVDPPRDSDAEGTIELYNSDGSRPEISGNGTRCAAAFLIKHGYAPGVVRVRTGAGIKSLRLLKRSGLEFEFEMNMGQARILDPTLSLPLTTSVRNVVFIDVGNPQCAVPVETFDFDWRAIGAEIEHHPHFPNRTNVSFIKPAGSHAIDALFWERGAGETMSSGTGSTGAAAAAVTRGMAQFPVEVRTPAGPIALREEKGELHLTGPAVLIGEGEFWT